MGFRLRYNRAKDEYYSISKKILNYETRRELKDNERKEQYAFELVAVYNRFLKFVRENLPLQSETIRNRVHSKFESYYEPNFLRCLHTLGLDAVLPLEFNEINQESLVTFEGQASGDNFSEPVGNIDTSPLNSDSESGGEDKLNLKRDTISDRKQIQDKAVVDSIVNVSNISLGNQQNTIENMTLTKIDYHNMCTRTINTIFSGDPLALQPFIDAIEACEGLDENNAFTATLKCVILMKLQGIARDCIDDAANMTIAQIKKKLKDTIKPETSIVVEGKLAALKADRNNFTDFAKKAEALAEQFQRSLVLEGMPYD